jgi:hypothetical protein
MLPVLPCRARLSRNMILHAAALLNPPQAKTTGTAFRA